MREPFNREETMKKATIRLALSAAALALTAGLALAGADTKVALVPGGPHPYFAAWEQAGADAVKDFGLGAADYRVPQKWELSQQSQLLESLLTQGYNSFLIFPGDAVGTNTVVQEIVDNGGQALALAGCLKDPTPALFCMGTDTGNSAYLGTKELIKAMGGKGKIAHFTGFLVDPNTQLRKPPLTTPTWPTPSRQSAICQRPAQGQASCGTLPPC